MTDVRALAKIAHDAGAMLSIDATFTPPPMFRGLEHDADFVVHALTKYINGHGDAMGGAVIGRAELIRRLKADALVDVGGSISPFNAWLIMRGSVTLLLRLAQHVATAQRVAEFLDKDPRVAFVAFPGLPSHPQHRPSRSDCGYRGGARRDVRLTDNVLRAFQLEVRLKFRAVLADQRALAAWGKFQSDVE